MNERSRKVLEQSLLIQIISETLEYLVYLLLTNLAAQRCTLSTFSLLYFWYGSQTVALYSIKVLREVTHSGSGVLAMEREAAASGSPIYPGQFNYFQIKT